MSRKLRVHEGDVHFHPKADWVFTMKQAADSAGNGFDVYRQNQAEKIVAVKNFYVNLSQAAARHEKVKKWLNEAAPANNPHRNPLEERS